MPEVHPVTPWLIRVPPVFAGLTGELMRQLGVTSARKLGQDYHLTGLPSAEALQSPVAALLIPWKMPVQHAWACHPQEQRGFIEQAAQALVQRFADEKPQAVLVGPLDADPSQHRQRALASNLRGRLLQVFPEMSAPKHDAEAQDPALPTLFCLVGREGLYAGMQSPRDCGGFHPGGTRFIRQGGAGVVSRAGAKVAEALHHLRLHHPALPKECHWLELGASPGGMTAELLARGWRVTALDRARLDPKLLRTANLTFIQTDVSEFHPRREETFDAILCDMNGEAMGSLRQVMRLAEHLRRGGLVIFTLKMAGVQTLPGMVALSREVVALAEGRGFRVVMQKHLSYNRHEFTLVFGRR